MAEKTYTEEELLAEGAQPLDDAMTEEELLAEGAQPLQLPTPERMAQELGQIGLGVASSVGSGAEAIGDAIKYLDAPINEAVMIPKRVSEAESLSDIGDAIMKPIEQVGESGTDAPTAREIMTSYGIPDENPEDPYRSVLWETFPKAAQLLKATTDISDENLSKITPTPATIGATAYDLGVGGKGLELGLKTVKGAASAGANVLGHATDLVTGNNMTSNLGKQTVQTIKDTGDEVADIFKKFANPKLVNTKIAHEGEEANIVKEMFADDVPNAVKYTKDSEIVKMENKLRSADYGGEIAKKHNGSIERAWNYITSYPQKMLKNTKIGRPLEGRQAGEFLIEKYNNVKNSIINSADITRAKAVKSLRAPEDPSMMGRFKRAVLGDDGYPRVTKDGLQRIQKTADALKERISKFTIGKNNPVAEQLAELKLIIDDVENISSVADLEGRIKSIADLAFNIESPFKPQDKKSLEKLYFAMTDAFTDTIKATMGEAKAAELVKNNEKLSTFFHSTDKIDTYLANRSASKLSPEGAFKELVEKADSSELKQLIENLPAEDLDVLRASYLNAKLTGKNLHITDEGLHIPKWKAIIQDLQKDQAFKILLKPEEQERIISALKIGEDLGAPVTNKIPTGISGMKDRLLLNPAIKRHVNVMENAAPVFDESGRIGTARDVVKTGLLKQNVLDNYRPPMMTPEEQLMMIDQDSSLLPSQRALQKQKIFDGR